MKEKLIKKLRGFMRRIIENPYAAPALAPAIEAAKQLGLTVGKGYALGNTELGITLVTVEGRSFIVDMHVKNWKNADKAVRAAAKRNGVVVPPDCAGANPNHAKQHPQP